MSGLHQACARAIADACDSWTQLGDPPPLGPLALEACAAAAVRVCLAEAQRAVESLPREPIPSGGLIVSDGLLAPRLVLRERALAVLAALAEDEA